MMDKIQININEITHKIIGCAMQVHSTLGNGFQEVIYQRALAIEMGIAGLSFQRETEMPIFYREEQIGTRRVDFFVEDCVMVELKAMEKIDRLSISATEKADSTKSLAKIDHSKLYDIKGFFTDNKSLSLVNLGKALQDALKQNTK